MGPRSDAGSAQRRDWPGARAEQEYSAPVFQAQQGEPEQDNSPVDCCPGERPSQEGLGRYASEAGTAKHRGVAQEGKPRAFERSGSA